MGFRIKERELARQMNRERARLMQYQLEAAHFSKLTWQGKDAEAEFLRKLQSIKNKFPLDGLALDLAKSFERQITGESLPQTVIHQKLLASIVADLL